MLAQKPGDNEMPVPASGQPVPGAAFAVPKLTRVSATASHRAPRVRLGRLTESNIKNSPLSTINSFEINPLPPERWARKRKQLASLHRHFDPGARSVAAPCERQRIDLGADDRKPVV